MNSKGLMLGRLRGIEISMDVGVIPLLGVLTWLLASSVLPHSVPGHIGLTYWTVALLIALLFIASLLAHELAHSLVARRLGIGVKGIVLWLFGGVSELDTEPPTPGAQLAISIAGPLTSIGFGAVSLASASALAAAGGPPIYTTSLQWLGIVNVALGAFNMLPGAPLDGGHVLGAVIWKLTNDRLKGLIAAAVVGRFLGISLVAFGLFELSAYGMWLGFWNIGLGFMLYQAARYQEQALRLERALGDRTVSELMDTAPASASSLATISQVVDKARSAEAQSAVPILNWNGHVVALIELADLYAVPRNRWEDTTALAAAPQDQEFVVASPTEKVADLLVRMSRLRRRHAAVVADGALIGLIGPEQIVKGT